MRGQSGIIDGANFWMIVHESRKLEPTRAVSLHPQRQRLGPSQDQPRIKWTQDRTGGVLHECQPLDVVVTRSDDDSADTVAVSVQVLRRAVGHEIRTVFDGPLDIRTAKLVVADETASMPMAE